MESQDCPLVLGVDAATPPASVAVVRDREVLACETGPFGRGTDAWIAGAVGRALAAAGCRLADVDAFAATVGPGTFTGIRVGLATAAGLGRGRDRPVAGIGTMDALVAAARAGDDPDADVLAVLDARRGQLYAALATRETPGLAWGPELMDSEELRQRLADTPASRIVGTAGELLEGLRVEAPGHDLPPVAAGAALAAATLLAGGGAEALPAPRPAYFRPPDAVPGTSPLRRRRRRG